LYVYVKDVALQKLREAGVKGRSGHWNHAGIPGHKGGSLPGLSAQGSDFVIKVSGRLTPWEFSKEGVDGMVSSVKNTLSEMGEDWSKELRLVLIEDTEDMTGRSGSYLGVGQYMDGAIIIHPTNVMKAFSRQLPIKEAFRRVFTHELAHHYFSQHESEFSSFSSTPFSLLWVGIHAKALDGGKSPTVHSLDNPSEYFSAAFEQYVLNQRGTIEVEAWDWFDKNVGRKKFMSESVLEFGTPKSGHWGHSSVAGRRGGSAPGKGAPKDPDKPPEMKAPRFGPEAERVLGSVKRMAGVTLSKDAFRAIQVAVETVLDAVPDNFLRGLNGVEARAGAERWAFYDSKGKRNVIVIYPEHFKETHAVVNLAGFPPERPTTYKDLHIIVAHELGHHISDNILTPYEVEMFDNWRKQTGEALRKQTGGFTPDKPVSTGDWRIARQYGLDWGEFFTVNFEAYAAGRYKFISPPVLEWFDNNIKRFQKRVESVDEVGTAKSGHRGHAGIPGHKGGSLPGTAKDVVGIEKNASYTALLAFGVITKEEDEVVLSKIRGYLDKIPAEWAEKVDIVLNDQDARSPMNLGLYVQNSTDPKLNRPGGSAIVYVGSVKMAYEDPTTPSIYMGIQDWRELVGVVAAHEIGHAIWYDHLNQGQKDFFIQEWEMAESGIGKPPPRSYGLKNYREFFSVNFEAWISGHDSMMNPRIVYWFNEEVGRRLKKESYHGKYVVTEYGVKGRSGHWKHQSQPGHRGGSLPKDGQLSLALDTPAPQMKAPTFGPEAARLLSKIAMEFGEIPGMGLPSFAPPRDVLDVTLNSIKDILAQIPDGYLVGLEGIYITNAANAGYYGCGFYSGATGAKRITITPENFGRDLTGKGFVGFTSDRPITPADTHLIVGHEIAHHVWYEHLTTDELNINRKAWNKVKEDDRLGVTPPNPDYRVARPYALQSESEFFAVAFEAYAAGRFEYVSKPLLTFFDKKFKRPTKRIESVLEYGVKGRSGHWGHSSVPGHRGGSTKGKGSATPIKTLGNTVPSAVVYPYAFAPGVLDLLSKSQFSSLEKEINKYMSKIPIDWVWGAKIEFLGRGPYMAWYEEGPGGSRIYVSLSKIQHSINPPSEGGHVAWKPFGADISWEEWSAVCLGHEIGHHFWSNGIIGFGDREFFRRSFSRARKGTFGMMAPRGYGLKNVREFFAVNYEAWLIGKHNLMHPTIKDWFDKHASLQRTESVLEFGTTKSGHWGHKGIPKHKGGSLPKGDGGGNLNPALVTGSSDYIAKGRSFSDDVETISESAGKLPKEWFNGIVGVVLHTAPELKGGKYGTYAGWYDEVGTRVIGKPQDAVIHLNVDAFTGPANTFLHEMGHHFLHNFAKSEDFDKLDEFFVAAEREQIPYPRLYAMSSPSEFFCESLEFFLRGDVEGTVAPVVQDFIKGVLSRSYKKESIDEASKFLSVASLNPIRRAFTSIQSVLSGNVLNRSSMYGQSVEMINKAMGNYQSAIDNLVGDLESGRLSPEEALSRFKVTAENSYRVAYLAGGYRAGNPFYRDLGITPEDTSQVGGAMNFESGFWQDFQRDIKDKSYPRERVETRAKMYGDAIYSQYWNGYTAGLPDTTELAWIMGDAEHCEDCENMAANSPYTKASLPTVPRAGDTRCLSNCKCRILELVNEDILTNKMLPPKVGMSRSELYGMNPVEVLMSNGEAASPDVTTMLAGIYAEINRLRQLIEIDQGNLQMYVLARKRAVEQAIGLAQVYNVTVIPKYAVSELVGAVQGMISHGWELARSGGAFQVGQMVREVRSVFINAGLVTSVTGDIIRVMTPRGELVVNVPESLVFVQGA